MKLAYVRKRVDVNQLTEWINEGFILLNRPPGFDPYAALKSDKVRMSSIAGVCHRKTHYGERYPELDMPDQEDTNSMSGIVRMVMGTLIHEGEFLAHKGEVKELELDVENITGHCDIYLPREGIVIDIKTTKWIPEDPHIHHVEQLEGYYAALNKSGHPCHQLYLFYLNTCRAEYKLFEIVEKPLPDSPIEPFVPSENISRQVLVRNRTIDEIWEHCQTVRDILLKARKEGELPEPVNPDINRKGHWLCEKYCAFRKRCLMNSL